MKKIKLIAMDMDGTLTQHKSPLDPECRSTLEQLRHEYKLLMLCAGGCQRVYEQLGHFDIDISGFYGMQYGEVRNSILSVKQNIEVSVDKEKIRLYAEQIRNEFSYHDYVGDSIEFHSSGLITFPILGTKALLTDKLAYDPDRSKRRLVFDRICDIFEGFNVFIGGTSSFDIAPKPFNKYYALVDYLRRNNTSCDEVLFFGDDYGIGGNDRCVFESDIRSVGVDDYREFTKIVYQVINSL